MVRPVGARVVQRCIQAQRPITNNALMHTSNPTGNDASFSNAVVGYASSVPESDQKVKDVEQQKLVQATAGTDNLMNVPGRRRFECSERREDCVVVAADSL